MLVKRVVLLLLAAPFLVPTDYMVADIFTNATDKETFFKMRNYMMNVNGNLRGPLSPVRGTISVCRRVEAYYRSDDAAALVVEFYMPRGETWARFPEAQSTFAWNVCVLGVRICGHLCLYLLWTSVQGGALSDRDNEIWVMVRYVPVAWCVCVSSFVEGLRSCGCCCRVLTATAVPTGAVSCYTEFTRGSTMVSSNNVACNLRVLGSRLPVP